MGDYFVAKNMEPEKHTEMTMKKTCFKNRLAVCTLFESTAQSNLPEFHCNSIVSKHPSLQGDLEMNEIHTASAISQILG